MHLWEPSFLENNLIRPQILSSDSHDHKMESIPLRVNQELLLAHFLSSMFGHLSCIIWEIELQLQLIFYPEFSNLPLLLKVKEF